jgi:hypothetical protein
LKQAVRPDPLYKRRTLLLIAGFLLLEGAAIVALPSRAPRAVRALTAGVNLAAAAGLWLFSRRRE